MKKIIVGAIASICLMTLIAVLIKNNSKTNSANNAVQKQSANVADGLNSEQPAEKIEVVHFHGMHQCPSCIAVGEFALKTIQEKFSEEYKNGKIIYKDINGELPENKNMVMKYQAGGSSLFINAIKNGQDNIEEDTTVWRLISDENKFMDYFQDKLNKILGE